MYAFTDTRKQTQNKPNSNPISKMPKMNVSFCLTRDYGKNSPGWLTKTNPIQTQFKSKRSLPLPDCCKAQIPTGKLLGIPKPGTNFKSGVFQRKLVHKAQEHKAQGHKAQDSACVLNRDKAALSIPAARGRDWHPGGNRFGGESAQCHTAYI